MNFVVAVADLKPHNYHSVKVSAFTFLFKKHIDKSYSIKYS